VWLTNRNVDLVSEGFDAAVRASGSKLKDSSLVAQKLAKLEFHVYASPTYIARRGAPDTPADVANHDWVELRGWKYSRELASIHRGSRILCDDFLFAREALRAGAGLGVLPSFLGRADVDAGLLVNALPTVRQTGGQIVLIHERTKQMPKRLAVFREFLAGTFSSAGL
jgi:DNA-binding transcriptional LysR family regulator